MPAEPTERSVDSDCDCSIVVAATNRATTANAEIIIRFIGASVGPSRTFVNGTGNEVQRSPANADSIGYMEAKEPVLVLVGNSHSCREMTVD
jgi:hypothetical protein